MINRALRSLAIKNSGRAALLAGLTVLFALFQNCAPSRSVVPGAPSQVVDQGAATALIAPGTDDAVRKIAYHMREGGEREIELELDHGARRLLLRTVDDPAHPIDCAGTDTGESYRQVSDILSRLVIASAAPGAVCTLNVRDSVDVIFSDSTSRHVGFSRCDDAAAGDQSLKTYIRALVGSCPN